MLNDEKKEKRIRIWTWIKWGLGLAVLLAGMIFVTVNRGLCYNTYITSKMKDSKQQVVYLEENSVCEQDFKGYNGTLEQVGLYVDNQGRDRAEGKVVVIVKDSDGNELARCERNASAMGTRKYTYFTFDKAPKLKSKNIYTVVMQCNGVHNDQGFGIYTTTKGKKRLLDTTIDGTAAAEAIDMKVRFVFQYYDSGTLKGMLGFLLLCGFLAVIPYPWIQKKIKDKTDRDIYISRWISRVLFVLSPLVAYIMVETLSGYTVSKTLGTIFTPRGGVNLALYVVLLLVFFAITNKTQYSAILLWLVTFVFGLTNYFVFNFRGIPVLAADILSVGTALNVAGEFEYTYDIWVLQAAAIWAGFTGLMLSLTPYKGFRWIKRGIVAAVTIVIVIIANWFYIDSQNVSKLGIIDSQWKPQLTYEKNGSLLSFVTSWKYIKTEKPEGYSVEEVKAVTEKYPSDDTEKTNAADKKLPNVIAIMNESLADFAYDGELKTTEDYLPFIHSLEENTIKGKLYVSIWGANTANSEFEFLTGNSLAFFAPRSVPYNNYVHGIVPSLTRTLAAQGYVGNNSYHPYRRSGWNRENVYNSFGFNHFYSDGYYTDAEYIRNFISDKSDMEQIIKDYETQRQTSDDPFYLFNVTVQNHGGYVGNRGFVQIDVKSESTGMDTDDVNQYLTLAKKSDEAFQELVEYFEKVDEPTVIVMFGDHQPPLSDAFYSTLFGTDVESLSVEQTAAMYSTPYVIWANYDIEEQQDFDMSANYLSSYMLQLIGADMTGYNKYLVDIQKKLPVFTGMFYQGDDGVFHAVDEESKYSDLIQEYSWLQYNGLFETKDRVNDFFFLTDGDYEVENNAE